jgi:hypothetical protein
MLRNKAVVYRVGEDAQGHLFDEIVQQKRAISSATERKDAVIVWVPVLALFKGTFNLFPKGFLAEIFPFPVRRADTADPILVKAYAGIVFW